MTGKSLRDVFSFSGVPGTYMLPMVLTLLGIGVLLSEMDNLLWLILPAPAWFDEIFQEMMPVRTEHIGCVPNPLQG